MIERKNGFDFAAVQNMTSELEIDIFLRDFISFTITNVTFNVYINIEVLVNFRKALTPHGSI